MERNYKFKFGKNKTDLYKSDFCIIILMYSSTEK